METKSLMDSLNIRLMPWWSVLNIDSPPQNYQLPFMVTRAYTNWVAPSGTNWLNVMTTQASWPQLVLIGRAINRGSALLPPSGA